jgi:2-haloacid dehalogenase
MAARVEGYLSAFVHRPEEWGPTGPPDPVPNPTHDIVAQDFADLATQLGA